MAKVGDPKESRKLFLSRVTRSILLYGLQQFKLPNNLLQIQAHIPRSNVQVSELFHEIIQLIKYIEQARSKKY